MKIVPNQEFDECHHCSSVIGQFNNHAVFLFYLQNMSLISTLLCPKVVSSAVVTFFSFLFFLSCMIFFLLYFHLDNKATLILKKKTYCTFSFLHFTKCGIGMVKSFNNVDQYLWTKKKEKSCYIVNAVCGGMAEIPCHNGLCLPDAII